MPAWLHKIFAAWHPDSSFDEEIELHLKMLQERFICRGMRPDDALYAARRQFGNTTLLKQTRREMSPLSWLEALRRDVRFALRGLNRNPAFAAVAVLTLAMGVGANTAIFSIVKAVLLDPLPYTDPGRLVTISETAPGDPDAPGLDYATAAELRWRVQSFDQMCAFRDGPGVLFENGTPEMLRGLSVDYRGLQPTIGTATEVGAWSFPAAILMVAFAGAVGPIAKGETMVPLVPQILENQTLYPPIFLDHSPLRW